MSKARGSSTSSPKSFHLDVTAGASSTGCVYLTPRRETCRQEKQFAALKRVFRHVLKGWSVEYKPRGRKKACCTWSLSGKLAVIHGYGGKDVPEDYMLHEFLHVCLAAADTKGKKEHLIMSVCGLWERRCLRDEP
jgi:hypothetical protein